MGAPLSNVLLSPDLFRSELLRQQRADYQIAHTSTGDKGRNKSLSLTAIWTMDHRGYSLMGRLETNKKNLRNQYVSNLKSILCADTLSVDYTQHCNTAERTT